MATNRTFGNMLNQKTNISMPKEEFTEEHKRLISRLHSHKKLKAEERIQKKEMKKYHISGWENETNE
jgi:hypothetical protein